VDNSHPSGAYSLDEILSQPQFWSAILEDLQQDKKLHSVAKRFARTSEVRPEREISTGTQFPAPAETATRWSLVITVVLPPATSGDGTQS
jgi:hypothetical protein